MTNINADYCSQCPNHCPVTDLKCGKGRNYFEQMRGQESEEKSEWIGQNHQRGEKHDQHYKKHKHDKEFYNNRNDLYGLMRACGHYLFHCSGNSLEQGEIPGSSAEQHVIMNQTHEKEHPIFNVLDESEQEELKKLLTKLLTCWK